MLICYTYQIMKMGANEINIKWIRYKLFVCQTFWTVAYCIA